jgi:TRAP-type C4-dicarboxylate transport system permease small subunit
MGIAIGFRERLHLGMDIFSKLPKKILDMSDRLVDFVTFFFGLYLLVYGWEFALMMRGSVLAATQLPNAIQYIVMPITGIMTCVYSGLQLLGRDLRRYHVIEEEIMRDAE